jgi:hypothetical protein
MTSEFLPESPRPIDKRLTGERNRQQLLDYLNRFGWLTSKMVAALIWPDGTQALAMARRLLKVMLDEKFILRRELPGGVDCYTLSASGAKALTAATGAAANSGATMQLGNVLHRACSNWYLISHIAAENTVWTEHEIQTERSPLRIVDGKVPDGLIETPEGLLWVEVENAWKARQERAKVTRFSVNHLTRDTQLSLLATGQHLLRVVIVGTTQPALDAMVRSFAQLHQAGELSDGQAGNVDLVLLPVDRSLNAGVMQTGNLYWDGLNPL